MVSAVDPEPIDFSVDHVVEANGLGVTANSETMLPPVSFTLKMGECLAVTGPNGSGKTTLLRVLAGLMKPTSGRALVAGFEVDERDRRFRRVVAGLIGYPPVARDLTVEEHLTLVGVSWGASASSARKRAGDLLNDFGIGRLRLRFPHELSSGQSQLFSLTLALTRPFDVLLLDEPEQRLDAEHLALVTRALREVINGGKTLILASHNSALIDAVADERLALPSVCG
jgi:ABC-2 type transport system ATP-binding protein